MSNFKTALLASALILAAGSAGAANLVVNGGFAGNFAPNGGFTTVGVGSGVIPAWTVFGGNVDWIHGYWQSSDGDGFSVDMDGTTQGAIGQYINTVAGQQYKLTFDMSGNPDAGTDTDYLGVFASGFLSPNATYSVTGANSHGNMNWSQRSYTFTANSSSTLIGFQSLNQNLCCYGAAIDNVSVSGAVPEPATWAMMIIGFGAAGSMIRRRKLATAA